MKQNLKLLSFDLKLEYSLLFFFFASTEQNACPPGWRNLGESCLRVQIKPKETWKDARFECHNRGGRLAVLGNVVKPQTLSSLSRFMDEYLEEQVYFFVGAYAISDGRWITARKQLFPAQSLLWGPSEPSGDGWCTDLIFGEKWNSNWKGKGWRINDENCLSKEGFVCQKPKTTAGNNTKNYQTNLVYIRLI